MSLVEEELPGVSNVRKDFQLKEDSVLAKRLQEREYEDHFNTNVQLRRTAMEDVKVAKKYQVEELGEFKKQESIRKQQLEAQESMDFQEAERLARLLEKEEERKRKQDEEMALKYHQEESEMAQRRRRQEEIDMGLARRHMEREQQQREDDQRRREMEDEQTAKKLQQLELSNKKKTPSVTSSLPVGSTSTKQMRPDLPSYDSLGFISASNLPEVDGDVEDEPVDEQARQEEEDARMARELMEREQQAEARRRAEQERADIELARKLMETEKKPSGSGQPRNQDMQMAEQMRRSEEEKLSRQKQMERRDMEAAQRMAGELQRQQSEQEIDDWEFAKKLQKEELKKAKARGPPRTMSQQQQPQQPQAQQQFQQQQRPVPNSSNPSPPPHVEQPNSDVSTGSAGCQRLQDTPNGVDSPKAKMGKKRQQQPSKDTKKSFLKKK